MRELDNQIENLRNKIVNYPFIVNNDYFRNQLVIGKRRFLTVVK